MHRVKSLVVAHSLKKKFIYFFYSEQYQTINKIFNSRN